MKTIETERLILRPFTLDDVDASYQMNLDEKVSRYTHDGGVVSREEIKRRIREDVIGDYEKNGFGRMAVVEKSTGEFIGFAGLKYLADMDEVDIGYRFVSKAWGKGYATESAKPFIPYGFEDLKLDRILGLVLPDNKGSIRVLEKIGMKFVEEFEEEGLTALKYSIEKSEWR